MKTRKAELNIILKTFNKTNWKDRKTLHNRRAIYLFIEDSIVLYVGLTQHLKQRMSNHTTITDDWAGRNFSIYWDSDYTYIKLIDLEVEYIRLFEPPLNRSYQKVSWAQKAKELDEENKVKQLDVENKRQKELVRAYESPTLIQTWINERIVPPTPDEFIWGWERITGKNMNPDELKYLMKEFGL